MSFLDIAAWAVLIIVLLSIATLVVFLAMLPGSIARKRNHPWAQGVSVAGWVTLFFGLAFWPVALIWAYVDAPLPRPVEKP
jgi:membrane-bound acyltransferase YfiQ involved in biofilm formation